MKEFDLENYSAMNLGLSMKFTSRSQACEVLWLQNNSINNHLLHLLVNYFVNNKQKFRMTNTRAKISKEKEFRKLSKINSMVQCECMLDSPDVSSN